MPSLPKIIREVHISRQVFRMMLVVIATIACIGISHWTYESNSPQPSSGLSSTDVLGSETSTYTLKVNVPANFSDGATFRNGLILTGGDLIADNIIYSVTGGTGISVSAGQNPTITNTGVTSFQGKTGAITLIAGSGISLDGTTITNSDKGSSVQAFKTITISGQSDIVADGNTDGLTFAGAGGISLSTSADTDTLTITAPAPDYSLSGWTDDGAYVRLTSATDSVGIGTATPTSNLHVVGDTQLLGDVTIGSSATDLLTINSLISTGSTITPSTDLGADLGSQTLRFDNLWVANINSNSSQAFSGQTTFSYPPTNTTTSQASVWINPDGTTVSNGQLLAFSIAGYQRALVDAEGDILLGYNSLADAPSNSHTNPLTIFGHNGTEVTHIDTSGNLVSSGNLDINGSTSDIAGTLNLSGNNLTSSGALTITPAAGNNLNITLSGAGDFAVNTDDLYVDSSTGRVGVNTTAPTVTFQVGTTLYADDSTGTVGIGGTGAAKLYVVDNSANPTLLVRQNGTGDLMQLSDNGSLVFVVKDGGNVGIGTTAPDSKLEVSGTNTGKALVSLNETGSNNILVASSSGTNRLVLTSTGNLGIGTTTPVDKLQVAGTISSEVLSNVEGLRLTSGGTTKLAFKYSEGASFLDTPSSATSNKFTNPSFDTNITGWNYGYTLNDEFSDTLPATLATSTPVTIQSGGVSNPNPTVGSNIILNGTFDSASNWTNSGEWSIASGKASHVPPGSHRLYQDTLTLGNWYTTQYTILDWSTSATSYIKLGSGGQPDIHGANGTFLFTGRAITDGQFTISPNTPFIGSYDNITSQPLTLSSLFSTVSTSVANEYTAQTDVTLTAGTQAGLVVNLDNAATPTNFVIAYHDGTNVHLDKAVAGTYTSLINTAATYAAGATIKVIQNGTSYSLYYNGTKVGSTVSITDAGIISNTRHGVFSTYASNSFANFLVQSTVVNPSPVAGSELITNGNMETGNPPSSWIANGETITSVADERTGGSGIRSLSTTKVDTNWTYQNPTVTAGTWVKLSTWIKNVSGTYGAIQIYQPSGTGTLFPNSASSSWTNATAYGRLNNNNPAVGLYISGSVGSEIRYDDISMVPLTLSSLFSTVNVAASADHTVQTDITMTNGTQAGVVLNMDSSTNPTKFVIGYTNGSQACLDKNVSGTYTAVIACTNITYVAGQTLKVIQNGTSYSLWYNGTQVGTTQTISDVPTTNIHGVFSTYASNSFANFTVKGGINGSLATDGTNTRTVIDTTNKLTVGSGQLNFAGRVNDGDPKITYPTITRTAGTVGLADINNTSTGTFSVFNFGNPINMWWDAGGFLGSNDTGLGSIVAGTTYKIAKVVKATGTYTFVKGGIYTNWTLMEIVPTGSSDISPSLNSRQGGLFTSDNLHVPTTTWLPTPLAYSTFGTPGATATETTGPDGQTTSALSFTGGTVSGGKISITPVTGSELVVNGGFDNGTGWTTTSGWTINNGVLTGVIPNNSTTQSIAALSDNTWYFGTGTMSNRTGGSFRFLLDGNTQKTIFYKTTNGTHVGATRGGGNVTITMNGWDGGYGGDVDNISLKPLTLSSLFSTVSTSNADVIADVTISSLTSGTQGGLVLNLDSTSNPQNFIIVYHDGSKLWVDEVVAGVYTNKQNTTVALGAGALRVTRDGTKLRVYLNNALVGSELTMTANTNTKHGIFSTYASNTFDDFSLWNRSGYTDLPDTNLTVSQDTSVTYGGSAGSTKLVATSGSAYTQNVNVGDTNTYTLSAMVYTTGAAVTTADLNMVAGTQQLPTTFTSIGSGWYRATATVTGVASSKAYGVYVHANKTVYIDNLNLTASSSLASTLYVQNSTSGLGGMNVESTTTLNSGLSSLQALIVKGALSQTANLQEWQNSTGSVLSAVSSSGALGLGTSTPIAKLDVVSTTEQQRLGYDASNYWSSTVGATGALTMQGVGTGGSLTLSPTAGQNINVALSGTGDFAVNTNQLYVDTSTGKVGIGMAAPTANLDIAATSGSDALRLTNAGSTIAGLSYGTNYLALATNGTDPTNKLTNGSFESDVTTGGWTGSPTYSLDDEFSDTLPATLASGGVSNPTPTIGSDIVTNGTFASDTGWTKGTNWTISGGVAVDSGSSSTTSQPVTLTASTWYQQTLDIITRTAGGIYGWSIGGSSTLKSTTGAYVATSRPITGLESFIGITASGGFTGSIDNVTVKPLTLSTLFSTVTVAASTDHTVQADVTMTSGTQAGVVLNMDSASTPTTFVIGYINGTQACLDKNVSGTYTAVIACTNISYVAGQTVKVVQNGTSYSLFYNGTQVGTTQTISNVPTTNIHGVFSTYASNSFANFTVKGGVNGTLATDGVNTRTVVDTFGKLSVGSGTLNFATGGAAAGNPGLWYGSTARAAGKIIISDITPTSGLSFGFNSNGAGSTTDGLYFGTDGSTIYSRDNGSGKSVGTYIAGTAYKVATVVKSTGTYTFIKGGAYTNWTLLYSNPTSTFAQMYPVIITEGTTTIATSNYVRIPTASFLPTPLAYDTFTRADGAIGTSETTGPDSQTTSALTWTGGAVSGNKLVITPTVGSEAITNGGFDTDTAWTKGTGWSIGSGVATHVTGSSSQIEQPALTVGQWYQTTWTITSTDGIDAWARYGGALNGPYKNTTGTFTETNRAGSGTFAGIYHLTGGTVSVDDISYKPLTLSSLFSTVSTSDADVIADANVTTTYGTEAGLVTNLDSTSSPANFLIAYLSPAGNDRTSTWLRLDKNVGGTYTNLIQTAVTYSAGAPLRVVTYHSDANTLKVRVYYNNALVGTEQTVTDAGIIGNTKHGLFSTYSGNTFDNFSLFARGSDNEYAALTPDPLTVTRETTIKYNQSTSSAKLVAGATDGDFVESINVGDTSTYNVIAYAYTNGSAVTSADLSLYANTGTITTTYTPMGATGWYKLSGSVTGVASSVPYGVRVKAGKTVYVDDLKVQAGVGTAQTLYVMNTSSGVTGMNVQGLVNANQSGVATFSKAGTISDADFTNSGVNDGMIGIDTTNHRIYFREGGAWSYAAKAGGFQIPDYEASGLTDGDFLLPYVESHMSDEAIHGLYQKFDLNLILAKQGAVTFTQEVTLEGPAVFKSLSQFLDQTVFKNKVAFENRDMAGKAEISKFTDHVNVRFAKPFTTTPTIIFSLASPSSSESGNLTDGRQATLTDISASGFTIRLDMTAVNDYLYHWMAFPVTTATTTKSESDLSKLMNMDVAGTATDSGEIGTGHTPDELDILDIVSKYATVSASASGVSK